MPVKVADNASSIAFVSKIVLKLCSFFPNYASFFKIMLFEKKNFF